MGRKKKITPQEITEDLVINESLLNEKEEFIENLKKRLEDSSISVKDLTSQELAVIKFYNLLSPKRWKTLRNELSETWWSDREEAFEIYLTLAPEINNTILPRLNVYASKLCLYYQEFSHLNIFKGNSELYVKYRNLYYKELVNTTELLGIELEIFSNMNPELKKSDSKISKRERYLRELLEEYKENLHLYENGLEYFDKLQNGDVKRDGNNLVINEDFFEVRRDIKLINKVLSEAKGYILSIENWIKKYNLYPFINVDLVYYIDQIKNPMFLDLTPELFERTYKGYKGDGVNNFSIYIPDYNNVLPNADIYERNLIIYNSLVK